MFLAKRIKEERFKNNLTQEELGKLLNVSKVSVCHWEKGIKKPSSKNLILLSKVLQVPLEYLIGNDTYVVAENDASYHMYLAKEEVNIILELRKHKQLYQDLIENTERTLERIDKKLF